MDMQQILSQWARALRCWAALLCAAVLFAAPVLADPRDQTEVLQWDDGECDLGIGSSGAAAVAVWFQAPEWANSVTGIHVYITDDGDPTTWAFSAAMWAPAGSWPHSPGSQTGPVMESGTDYWEDSWVLLPFPEPVGIADPAEFPDRVFFVGVVWETAHPLIGGDWDVPQDLKGWMFDWTDWEPLEVCDLMIRAVVSDDTTTAVAPLSWGRIKTLYLEE